MTARDLSPAAEARVLPFRRPSSAVRVRRRSPWLVLGRHFAQALLLVGGPIAMGLWLFSSPTFALTRVGVDGNRFVDRAWVDHALSPLMGANLLSLPLPLVEELLATNPWIEGVTVEKRLPNELRVSLVERRPAALLREGRTLVYLDEAGRSIAPFDPVRDPVRDPLADPASDSATGAVADPLQEPRDLLLISVSPATGAAPVGAFEVVRELAESAPKWAETLSEVEVLGEGDFRLYLGALAFPLLVRAGTVKERVGELEKLLPELDRRYPKLAFIDLRFDRRIIFQPAL
ncbi:MAG: FtsQ-type POTRA domain-containing protein [Thermoanaerobaculia bacterium]